MSNKPIADGARLQGILAGGYGLIPRIVVRDERLTPEAKAIYGYLSALSGASYNPVFPSRELMLKELGMSINRFYKHMQLLIDFNYIVIERTIDGNIFGKNIYSLVLVPEIETQNIRVKRPAKIVKRLDRPQSTENCADQSTEVQTLEKAYEAKATPKNTKSEGKCENKNSSSAGNSLKAQLEIDSLIQKRPEMSELIMDILMVIEDMEMSEQVRINGSVKKRKAIKQLIGNLTQVHVETLINNISGSGQKIRNKKSYLQSCIGNVLLDVTAPLDFSSKPVNQHEEVLENNNAQLQIAEYERIPELKQIDRQISSIGLKISRSILSGNEIQTKALKSEKEQLEKIREKMILDSSAIEDGMPDLQSISATEYR